MKTALLASATLVALASAQQVTWGQCGGINYSGATDCTGGTFCTSLNPWYYQCVPGTATSTTKQSTTAAVTTTTSSKPLTTTEVTTTTKLSSMTKTTTATATSASSGGGSGSYVTTSGLQFVIDGKKGYFAGTNTYWISFLSSTADVDKVMGHIKSSGLKVLRVWEFNDVTSIPSSGTAWFQSFVSGQTPTINTGSDGLQRLDYVVSAAEKNGIKLVIPFVNNWGDYGGMAAYMSYCGGSQTGWYASSCAQNQYKKYIAAVISRYKTSKAIFAWELANEPRCSGCSTSVITSWATSVSAYIKSLDSNHLVTIGYEGFGLDGNGDTSYPYTSYEGLDFAKNLAISTIDYGTFHLYPSQWGETDSWGSSWVTTHGKAAASVGKPVVFEEYGSKTHSNEVAWQSTVLKDNNIAGDQFWQFGDSLSYGNSPDDGYTIYYGSSEYNSLVTSHASAMNAR